MHLSERLFLRVTNQCLKLECRFLEEPLQFPLSRRNQMVDSFRLFVMPSYQNKCAKIHGPKYHPKSGHSMNYQSFGAEWTFILFCWRDREKWTNLGPQ